MAIYLLIIMLSLLVLHIYLRYSRTGRLLHAVPGPSAIPLLGNLLHLGTNKTEAEMWELLQVFGMKYYPVFKGWMLTVRMFAILHPDDVKILLSEKENISKGFMYKYTEPAFGKGLLNSTGDKYHSRRKLISPAFSPNNLRNLIVITHKQGKDLIGRLRDAGDETIHNPKLILPRVTLNIICEWCMGVDLRTIEKESTEYHHAIQTFTELVLYRAFRPYLNDWMIKFLEAGRKMDHVVKITKSFIYKMINDRRNYHKSTNYKDVVTDGTDASNSSETKASHTSYCLMDILLAAEKDGLIDGKGIEEELQTIIAAKLDYIERCIKESMRLCPSIPFIARTLQTDLHIRDYILPAGSGAAVSIYNIHRNPEFWSNPEEFDPDRFLPEQVKTRHPFAFIPFSTGIRNCIGQKYAIIQLKVLAAMILSNFELEVIGKTADIKFQMDFVLTPTRPLNIKFIKLQTKR